MTSALDREMAKMKAMGVTVSVKLARPDDDGPARRIGEAAEKAGISYGEPVSAQVPPPRTYTDDQIQAAITKALKAQDVKAIPGLIALLALQNPTLAEQIRQMILMGLSIATNGAALPGTDKENPA